MVPFLFFIIKNRTIKNEIGWLSEVKFNSVEWWSLFCFLSYPDKMYMNISVSVVDLFIYIPAHFFVLSFEFFGS